MIPCFSEKPPLGVNLQVLGAEQLRGLFLAVPPESDICFPPGTFHSMIIRDITLTSPWFDRAYSVEILPIVFVCYMWVYMYVCMLWSDHAYRHFGNHANSDDAGRAVRRLVTKPRRSSCSQRGLRRVLVSTRRVDVVDAAASGQVQWQRLIQYEIHKIACLLGGTVFVATLSLWFVGIIRSI